MRLDISFKLKSLLSKILKTGRIEFMTALQQAHAAAIQTAHTLLEHAVQDQMKDTINAKVFYGINNFSSFFYCYLTVDIS